MVDRGGELRFHRDMTVPKVLVLAAFAYGAIVAAAFVLQRSLMYFPGRALPPAAPPFSPVTLQTGDGLALTAWYAPPAAPGAGVIVYFQGNAGSITDRAPQMLPFLNDGHGVLLAGYRGYGGNPGKPTEAGLLADGRAAVQYVLDQGVARDRIVLFGESLGGGVAVPLAAADPFAAVILEAPFTSAADVGQRAYPFLPVRLLIKDRFDSLAVIGQVTAPLLVVHGGNDFIAPGTLGRRLCAAAPEPNAGHCLGRAGHNELAAHGATDIERAFLREVLGGG